MRILLPIVGLLLGCRPGPAVDPTGLEQRALDCPEAPEAMSHTEAAGVMARFAREARADLMTRLEGLSRSAFVTLHPPGLALLEAALASPAKARRMERAWLQRHLLQAYVEVQSQGPIAALNGDLKQVYLTDEQGRVARALQMTVRSDSQGWIYRFVFDPLLFETGQHRRVITFTLPVGDAIASARWRLTRASHLTAVDHLPQIYLMARQRQVRLARWALLLGEQQRAREILDEVLACAPDLTEARTLRDALRGARVAGDKRRRMPASDRVKLDRSRQQELQQGMGHDPPRDLALRAALLARLGKLTRMGVLPAEGVARALKALRAAVDQLSHRDPGRGLPVALVTVDTTIAQMLSAALDGESRPAGMPVQELVLEGAPVIGEQEVDQAISLRVLLANYGLMPRWFRGPRPPDREGGPDRELFRLHLMELRPEVTAKSGQRIVVARLDQRLGWGWLHPGLPSGLEYTVNFLDQGHLFWQGLVRKIRSIDELRPVARRLLRREIYGPDQQAAALAMDGLLQDNGPLALKKLLPLAASGLPERRALALRALAPRALALQRDTRVAEIIGRSAQSPLAAVRTAAMQALGDRGLPAERELLRNGLNDRDVQVAAAALLGLVRSSDPVGLRRARAWLTAGQSVQREVVLGFARQPGLDLSGLSRELLRLVKKREAHSELLVDALVRALGDRAARVLLGLFRSNATLRDAILQRVAGRAFSSIFLEALKSGSIETRRLGMRGLARLRHPQRRVLKGALEDRDRFIRLAAHVGLARLGEAESLLALGQGARGTCEERELVLPVLSRSMDASSRGALLQDALLSECPTSLLTQVWELVLRLQPKDIQLMRVAMGHRLRQVRVWGALWVLGLRRGAGQALGP